MGLNSTAWWYTKRALGERFRLVTWDLPGLGRSKPPMDGKFTIDRFAQSLGAVVESVGAGPVVLVGHSATGHRIVCLPSDPRRVFGRAPACSTAAMMFG